MAPRKFEHLWLKLLGGKPEQAGLGLATIAILFAVVGGLLAFFGSRASPAGAMYWVGYAICVAAFFVGACGIIYHRVLSQRSGNSHRNDA